MATAAKNALPTQDFVTVSAVKNGVLILKNGGLRQILLVSGINFDLKSEDEQNAVIAGYQNFLNSLNFTVQIFIHSRKVNIQGYIENLARLEAAESNPLLKTQIGEYKEFIKAFTSENAIMQKSFFVVVPYDPIQLGGNGEKPSFLSGIFGKKGADADEARKTEADNRFAEQAGQLSQRTEQIATGLSQLGLRATPLEDQEAIELLYNLYNPESVEKKGLRLTDEVKPIA